MNFCENCDFMLYTRLDQEKTGLINYCKNCGNENTYSHDSDGRICVYKKNYSNDYLAKKAFANKYTKYDPTLPRINNIECVNPKCLTNVDFDISKSLYISKTNNAKFTEDNIDTILSKLSVDKSALEYNLLLNDNQLLLITFKDDTSLDDLVNSDLEISPEFNVKIYKVLEKIQREIIFIKYDSINLKYLYLCSTCNTSWNTE